MIKTIETYPSHWDDEVNTLIENGWELTHFAVSGERGQFFVGVFEKSEE